MMIYVLNGLMLVILYLGVVKESKLAEIVIGVIAVSYVLLEIVVLSFDIKIKKDPFPQWLIELLYDIFVIFIFIYYDWVFIGSTYICGALLQRYSEERS